MHSRFVLSRRLPGCLPGILAFVVLAAPVVGYSAPAVADPVSSGLHGCTSTTMPKGPGAMELHWTYFGFEDDDPDMQRRRLKQANLVGPAGYVSMEDGCVGGFVQRGAAAAAAELSVVNMGGDGAESQETRATEASVCGFWKAYRRYMGY